MGIWYRTGTISVTNGSPNVVGVGTLWLTQASIGDIFNGPDGVEYEITSITDDTHAAIKQRLGTAAYAGATLSAQVYSIIRNFTSTLPAQLAAQLAAMITAWHQTTDEFTAWLSGTGNVTVHDSVGNAYSLATPTALNSNTAGRLVKSVAGSANVTLTATEAANLFLELTGAITAPISVIVPAAARQFHVFNSTTGAFVLTVKTAAGTGVPLSQGGRALLECDGTNVLHPLANLAGNVAVAGTLAVSGASALGAVNATTGTFSGAVSGTTGTFSGGITQEAKITPTLLNSWANYGAGRASATYWKDSVGVVHVEGTITGGTTIGATIFILPVGYRPVGTLDFCETPSQSVGVLADGTVYGLSGSTAYLPLNNISFRAV